MAAELFLLPFRPAISPNGLILPGAKLYFYLTGTTTKAAVFSDDSMTVELENPVMANAAGVWPDIYYDQTVTYRVVLHDQYDQLMDNTDPYIPGVSDGLSTYMQGLVQQATTAATNAAGSALTATDAALLAQQAVAIIAAEGAEYAFFASKADAVAGAGSLPDGFAFVLVDETEGNNFTVYEVTSGLLSADPVANLSPDLGGTMMEQDADDVSITGGSITNTTLAPIADTAANLAALAGSSALTPNALYVDTTNNRLKLATSSSAIIDVGPLPVGSSGTYDVLGSNFSGNSSTFEDTGLAFSAASLDANSAYEIELMALISVSSGNGARIGFTGLTNSTGGYSVDISDGGSGRSFTGSFASSLEISENIRGRSNTPWVVVRMKGILNTATGPSGDFKLRIRSASGSNSYTVAKGSFLMYKKLV